ncbi:MAG TPA: amino acid permease [Opitutaceae bacterium]|nr:amino acid permease [Opitutaceae bacterium]HND62799.1 amino acid permease [Opitutaceae bacterium]
MKLFQSKPVGTLIAESEGAHGMKRELNALNLVSLGIGSVVGAGIFVLAGTSAAQYAGPAIVFSFIIAGLGCLFAGLCYAEFATMIPVAGSAYTYTYATMGEFVAWIIGWDLILEYLFSGAAVAVSWSAAIQGLLAEFGISIPAAVGQAPFALDHGHITATGAIINLPAVFISVALTVILVIGIRESARFNNTMVFIKVGVLLVLIVYGAWWIFRHFELARQNLTPFVPANTGHFGDFGWSGVFKGAAVIFFAYVGFDNVSCAAQETKNPQRDMPIGLLACLGVCSFLFIAVALVLTAMVKYPQLNVEAPFIFVLQEIKAPAILRFSIEIATIAGLTSVALVSLLGQPRIFFSMAKDGLLPSAFSKLHPRFRTPYLATMLTGLVCSIVAGLLPLDLLGELISIGTLMAFAIVCLGILVLRRTRPDLARPFRTPWVPLVPILGAVTCVGMMFTLPPDTWLRLAIWMAIGFAVYFGYSVKHSTLRKQG